MGDPHGYQCQPTASHRCAHKIAEPILFLERVGCTIRGQCGQRTAFPATKDKLARPEGRDTGMSCPVCRQAIREGELLVLVRDNHPNPSIPRSCRWDPMTVLMHERCTRGEDPLSAVREPLPTPRPPKTQRAAAALKVPWHVADAIGTLKHSSDPDTGGGTPDDEAAGVRAPLPPRLPLRADGSQGSPAGVRCWHVSRSQNNPRS
jgi:hypothetical protein